SPGGEIHVFDTPFYSASELVAAQERTSAYYQQQGESAMQQHYFHRTWAELQVYQYEIKYDPSSLPNRLKRKLGSAVSPFPWLLIRNTTS
ncbi:MAG: hypothetical protein AAFY48_10655, partial [Bacteroidota bacterium]